MSDKLIEEHKLVNAAKAAGYEIEIQPSAVWLLAEGEGEFGRNLAGQWNPLESDADAFRLMVDAGISVWVSTKQVTAEKLNRFRTDKDYVCDEQYWFDHNEDKAAATRQAILDCAAAIGEKMP